MMAAGFTPLTNAKGKGSGPLPAASQDRERASQRLEAVSRPEPIRVSEEDTLFNKVPGRSSSSQRVPLANAKNTAETQATVLLWVKRCANRPTRDMVRASVNPCARSTAVQIGAEATRMN